MSYFKASDFASDFASVTSDFASFDADRALAEAMRDMELERQDEVMRDAEIARQLYEQDNEIQHNFIEAQRIQREWSAQTVQTVPRAQLVERKDTFSADRALAMELQRNERTYGPIGMDICDASRIVVQDGVLFFMCPHCGGRCSVVESEIACTIVTHAVTKDGQVNQHISPEAAAALKASGTVVAGCCLQYTLVKNADGSYKAEKCSGR